MGYEQNVRQVVPYTPGEQPKKKNIIKLNTNENPYPPAPGVCMAFKELDARRLRLYPDPLVSDLTEAIAEYHGVNKDRVFVGVGSDDVIAMAFLTFFNSDKPILFSDITYSFYDVWADLYRIPYKKCPLDENFEIVPDDYMIPNGGIVIANPNAPTGVFQSVDMIEEVLLANPDVAVIVDEAYVDFGAQTCIPLLEKYDNLLVIRTFSKSRSLAGLRIGYAVGNAGMIKYLSDVKFSYNSYTMNYPTICMGVEAIKDDEYFVKTCKKLMATRERSKEALKELGFHFKDSMANFIFATHESVRADVIFNELKARDIYVRYFNKPRIDNYLRISIGTDEEMDKLFAALREILGNK